MNSVRCVHCGLINWADAEACKRCGKAPQAAAEAEPGGWEPGASFGREAGYAPGANHIPGAGQAPGAGHVPFGAAKKRKGLALASLILGILSMPTFSLLLVGALTAFIMGVVALTRASKRPDLYGGRGLALGGIITSVLSIPITALLGIIAAIAVPNILIAARTANEASAVRSVREIILAEDQYSQTSGAGDYGTWRELVGADLLERTLAGGTKNGYRFELSVNGEACTVRATPLSYGRSGAKSFYAECGDDEIHFADRGGAHATAADPVVTQPTGGGRNLLKE